MDPSQSSRCAECVRTKSKCDGLEDSWDRNVPKLSDWESLDQQEERLRREEEEAMSKILRLRKQQDFLRKRRKEMSRRGLKFLDELDEVERRETEEKKEREAAVARLLSQPNPNVDPSGGPACEPGFLDPSFDPGDLWASLGIDGGMPQESQGS
jgi:hypothetical protein